LGGEKTQGGGNAINTVRISRGGEGIEMPDMTVGCPGRRKKTKKGKGHNILVVCSAGGKKKKQKKGIGRNGQPTTHRAAVHNGGQGREVCAGNDGPPVASGKGKE